MSEVPTDLSSERVVRALRKAGFIVARQGKHISTQIMRECGSSLIFM